MTITKAKALESTPEDQELAQAIEDRRRQSEKDSKRSAAVNEVKKRKEAMLAQARGEMAEAQTN